MVSLLQVLFAFLGACVYIVSGQSSAVASCTIVAGNAMVSANTTGYVGFKLGVFGCATLTNITADGVTVTTCPYTWGTNATAYITNTTYVQSGHVQIPVSCVRGTGSTRVTNGITVRTPTASATLRSNLSPTISTLFTAGSGTLTSPRVNSTWLGQALAFHVYITETALRTAFSIYVEKIYVYNAAGLNKTLTTGGCSADTTLWSNVVVATSNWHHKFTFNSFFLVPHVGTSDAQTYVALVHICANATHCNTSSCGGAVRKRRDVSEDYPASDETIEIAGSLRILPYEGYIEPTEVDVTIDQEEHQQPQPVDQQPECEVCMQKSVMYGVMSLLVVLLLLSVAVSCFLFLRTRSMPQKHVDYDREMMKGSSNPGYNN